jgi:hypothetical protein
MATFSIICCISAYWAFSRRLRAGAKGDNLRGL